jgi:hypothetical protein
VVIDNKKLKIVLHPHLIDIHPGGVKGLFDSRHFIAQLSNGLLHFDIQTRATENDPPYAGLHARELILLSFEYFSRMGTRPRGIVASWYEEHDGTNWRAYMEELKNGKSEEESACATWTGQIARELGFSHCRKTREVKSIAGRSSVEFEFT